MILRSRNIPASGGGGAGASFTVIQPDEGDNVIATGATDTLTHTSTELDITGDPDTDTITWAMKNAAVIGKVLTGFASGAGAVAATDTILQAFNKVVGNIAAKQDTGNYVTALTGEVTASGPGSAAATVTNSAVIAKVLTGFSAAAGTVAATDSILQAIQKIVGNITLLAGAEVDHGDMGATETFDFSASPAHYGNISADCTLTLSNYLSGQAYTAVIEANGTHEITWAGPTIEWGDDGVPDFSAMADGDLTLVNFYWCSKKSLILGSYKSYT